MLISKRDINASRKGHVEYRTGQELSLIPTRVKRYETGIKNNDDTNTVKPVW